MLSAKTVGQTQGAEASQAFSQALSGQQLSQGSLFCSAYLELDATLLDAAQKFPIRGMPIAMMPPTPDPKRA